MRSRCGCAAGWPRAPTSCARAPRWPRRNARQAAERDQARAEAALKQAAGIAQTQTLVLDWETALPRAGRRTLLADLLAEAQRQRPDLQALQAAAASARADAERARAARWPSLALAANAGRTYFLEDERTPSTTYSVGVNLSVPLFDGGRLAAEARAADRDAERLQAEADSAAQPGCARGDRGLSTTCAMRRRSAKAWRCSSTAPASRRRPPRRATAPASAACSNG
jgi:outer membrane protein